jgi:hypothetical protein
MSRKVLMHCDAQAASVYDTSLRKIRTTIKKLGLQENTRQNISSPVTNTCLP